MRKLIFIVTITITTVWTLWWVFGLAGLNAEPQDPNKDRLNDAADLRNELSTLHVAVSQSIFDDMASTVEAHRRGDFEQAKQGYGKIADFLTTKGVKSVKVLQSNISLAEQERRD